MQPNCGCGSIQSLGALTFNPAQLKAAIPAINTALAKQQSSQDMGLMSTVMWVGAGALVVGGAYYFWMSRKKA